MRQARSLIEPFLFLETVYTAPASDLRPHGPRLVRRGQTVTVRAQSLPWF